MRFWYLLIKAAISGEDFMGGIVRAALPSALVLLAATLALAAMNAPGLAQTLNDRKCTGNPDVPWDEQIVGCTNAIKSKKYAGNDLAAPSTIAASPT